MQHSGPAHLGVQEFAAHAVSLACHPLQMHGAEPNLLGHVNCPDAGAGAQIEDASFSVVWHGGLVQRVSPRHGEELVVDVHAVLFRLRCALVWLSLAMAGRWGEGGGWCQRAPLLTSSHGYW